MQCLYEEKSIVANSSVIGKASCLDRTNKELLTGVFQSPNPKGDIVLNKYQFFGPGVYNKDRVNYSKKNFFKEMKLSKVNMEKYFEDMRRDMHEDFAKRLRGNAMNKW